MGFLLFISLVDLFIVESGELLFIFSLFFTSAFFECLGALIFDIYICNVSIMSFCLPKGREENNEQRNSHWHLRNPSGYKVVL